MEEDCSASVPVIVMSLTISTHNADVLQLCCDRHGTPCGCARAPNGGRRRLFLFACAGGSAVERVACTRRRVC